jgi:hypothetical protein
MQTYRQLRPVIYVGASDLVAVGSNPTQIYSFQRLVFECEQLISWQRPSNRKKIFSINSDKMGIQEAQTPSTDFIKS